MLPPPGGGSSGGGGGAAARGGAAPPRPHRPPRRAAGARPGGGGGGGGGGAVDVGEQGVEIDLDDPVEEAGGVGEDLLVGPEVGGDLVGGVGEIAAAGGFEVAGDRLVVGEHRGGGADLGAHVADGGLAGGADGLGAGTEVLDDGAGASGDGE